jgi:cell division protein YceG involved in septum cleavage
MNNFDKKRKTFKLFVIGIVASTFLVLGAYIFIGYTVYDEVQEAGGFKQAVIKAGKEVKDIHEQIMADEVDKNE